MYKTPQNEYQEKEGKLVIRQKKKSLKKGDSYRGIGICTVNLASTYQLNQTTTISLPITQCSIPGATIQVHIMTKEIGEVLIYSLYSFC